MACVEWLFREKDIFGGRGAWKLLAGASERRLGLGTVVVGTLLEVCIDG